VTLAGPARAANPDGPVIEQSDVTRVISRFASQANTNNKNIKVTIRANTNNKNIKVTIRANTNNKNIKVTIRANTNNKNIKVTIRANHCTL
jgi:hypothetical protein